jgi:hypothetical protein
MTMTDEFANREITLFCEECGDMWFAPEGHRATCCYLPMTNTGFVEAYKEPR